MSTVQPPPYTPPQPSIRLLYTFATTRDLLLIVVPAFISSIAVGGVAPFMTLVLGQAFNAFAKFPLTPNPPEAAKKQLLHDVGFAAIALGALAVGSLTLSSLMSCLWIWVGERNVMRLRKAVYDAVMSREMDWFDTKMGTDDDAGNGAPDQERLGPAGLMSKFAK